MITRLVAFVLFAAILAPAWTDKGHRMLPELALKLLPPDVPVLRAYAAQVADAGPEPDRWRAGFPPIKDAQEPDHYINLERAAFLTEFPAVRHKFIEAIYAEAVRSGNAALRPETVGYQPYIVAEIFERLRLGFGEHARLRFLGQPTATVEQRIAFYAGWLSHYITDGAQPLHATIHYDGWTGENPDGFTTERGIHYKFEGLFVEENISADDVSSVAAKTLSLRELLPDYMAYLRHSSSLARSLYVLDKAGAFNGAGTKEGRAFVLERLAAGRDMLAAVWTAAYRQSQWDGCIPFTESATKQGQFGCVTGTVVNTTTSTGGLRRSTYLNFCEDFRNCALSVQISAGATGFPDIQSLIGRHLQFVGHIAQTGGRPIMTVHDPRQIRGNADQRR